MCRRPVLSSLIPSRELTYPTLGSSENHLQNAIFGGYVSSLEGNSTERGYYNHNDNYPFISVISGPMLSSSEDLDVSDAHPVHAVVKPNHGNTSEINHKYIYQHLPVGVPIEPYPG